MNRVRRNAALAGAALLAGTTGTTAALAAGPGAAAVAWAATATKAYNTFGAAQVGVTPAGQELNLVIPLKPRNQAAENAALRAMYTPGSATYHQYLTPAEWTAEYAPTAQTVSAVTGYLTSHGFTNVSVLSDRMVVTATGTAAEATSAFHTAISTFRAGSVVFYANTAPALVPQSLSGAVEAVLGLNDVPFPTPHPAARTKGQAAGSPSFNGIPPADFVNTYDAHGTGSGGRTSLALFTEGDVSPALKDLRLAESKNKLPQVPVQVIPVGPQSSDTSGEDEWDLDTQSSTAMAYTVKELYLYNTGSLVDSQIDLTFARFVADDRAQAMSASIGGCDLFPYLDGSMVSTDQVMQEGAMQGQTLFASSGDNGDGCAFLAATGFPSSFPGTNWPASGEFTTAVGGTSLISDAQGNRIQELGWIGSGGGISEVEAPGWWTQATDAGFSAEYLTGGRAVPDVALDADPNVATPALIYVNGQEIGVGGTSLSSPLMLGSWARLESDHANRLGFAPMDLYRLYDRVNPGTSVPGSPIPTIIPSANPSAVSGYTDITAGDNGLYPCTPGYDEVTGLGAPDVYKLDHAL